jgi:hypothetical protein
VTEPFAILLRLRGVYEYGTAAVEHLENVSEAAFTRTGTTA